MPNYWWIPNKLQIKELETSDKLQLRRMWMLDCMLDTLKQKPDIFKPWEIGFLRGLAKWYLIDRFATMTVVQHHKLEEIYKKRAI